MPLTPDIALEIQHMLLVYIQLLQHTQLPCGGSCNVKNNQEVQTYFIMSITLLEGSRASLYIHTSLSALGSLITDKSGAWMQALK